MLPSTDDAMKETLAMLPSYAEPILLAQTGSRAYGTGTDESDHDFRGVFMASLNDMLSVSEPASSFNRMNPHDVTVYELRHFCQLAAKANPTALETLWGTHFTCSDEGRYLRSNRDLFLSKRVAKTYGGYALSQLKRAREGTGGSRGADHHKRLKFRLHTLRLLDAGVAIFRSHQVTVLVPDAEKLWEQAQLPLDQIEKLARLKMAEMDSLARTSMLPEQPPLNAIDQVMYNLYTEGGR